MLDRLQPLGIQFWGRIGVWSLYASADQWKRQHKETECSHCSLWCQSVTQHQFHECIFTKTRVLLWSGPIREQLCEAGIQSSRVFPWWWGVQVLGNLKRCTIWCHPAKGAIITQTRFSENPAWPIWLGLGPTRGIFVVLSQLCVRHPHILIYKIRESACTMVHGGFDIANLRLTCPRFHSRWLAGMNVGVLLGSAALSDPKTFHTPSNLLRVLFSSVKAKGYVGHVLFGSGGHAFLST